MFCPKIPRHKLPPSRILLKRKLGGLLLRIEHYPPDGNAFTALALEYQQLPTGCTVPLTGTLVNHLISERDHRRITRSIDLMIIIAKLMDFGVVAEIPEPGKKLFPSVYAPDEVREHHHNLWVHHRREGFHISVEPEVVYPAHCRLRRFVFGLLSHPIAPSIQAAAQAPRCKEMATSRHTQRVLISLGTIAGLQMQFRQTARVGLRNKARDRAALASM